MEETLKMMESILSGKEESINEIELIKAYKNKLSPNILAHFFSNNYKLICNTNRLYPIITDEDKASFCLQELDNCLLKFDLSKNNKFITFFIKCYKNRLRMETQQLLTQKRKIMFILEDKDINCIENNFEQSIEDIDLLLRDYKLTSNEIKQCKLLNMGYNAKEISKKLKLSISTIYSSNIKIRKKILNSIINFN